MAPRSPSKTTPRRVLGDLPPNALKTPSKLTGALDAAEGLRAQSPLKQVTTLSPHLRMGKENLASMNAYPQGRKRSIHEVDDAENVEIAKAMFGARDTTMTGARVGLTAAAVQTHTVSPPAARRVQHVSNTVQDLTSVDLPTPGSPTERNTPSPEPEVLPAGANSQNTQTSEYSFSNFINTELLGSQTENAEQEKPPAPVEEAKKSRAELLRTRLRFGYYKVETNQVDKRGSEVISTWESSSPESNDASMSAPITSSVESAKSHRVPNITLSPVRRDAHPVFVEANLDPFRPIGKLTPAPVLLPTAVSSRMNYDYHLPSSPPQAASPQHVSPEQLMSPVRQKRRRTEEAAEEETVQGRLQSRLQEGDLTSSAVKGNAANGLLQLSHAR
jgi:hypothetical protein